MFLEYDSELEEDLDYLRVVLQVVEFNKHVAQGEMGEVFAYPDPPAAMGAVFPG